MTTDPGNDYDVVPYASQPFPQTHPDRMATLARVFGLAPPPVPRCRVLELGCASAGNLIPMASVLPESEFVGVDLSGREIEMGRAAIDALGLHNVRLEHASILDVDETWGPFDYVICHGVFSWVEKEIQNKILAIASTHLTPSGIAYVSYNTYPGWHMREMIRHMMRYHAAQFEEPAERIQQARAMLDFLVASVPPDSGAYGQFLTSELGLIRRCADWYLFHEHLERVNTPLYFHQFAERAEGYGLQYLAEAEFSTMLTERLPQAVGETLERVSPSILQLEQYMDFVRNRLFRQSLLCRAGLRPRRALSPAVLDGLLVASRICPESQPVDLSAGQKATFRAGGSAHVESESPVTKAALVILNERWPQAVGAEELASAALDRASPSISEEDAERGRRQLMADLFQCFLANLIQLRTWQPPCVRGVTDRPKGFAVAAYQARTQEHVVNVAHETIALDRLAREVLQAADGTRDRSQLLEHVTQRVRDGVLNVGGEEVPVRDEGALREFLTSAVAETLATLSRNALLVA